MIVAIDVERNFFGKEFSPGLEKADCFRFFDSLRLQAFSVIFDIAKSLQPLGRCMRVVWYPFFEGETNS